MRRVVLIIFALIIAAGVIIKFLPKPQAKPVAQIQTSNTATSTASVPLPEIVKSGKDNKCVSEDKKDGNTTVATMYMSGNFIRADLIMTTTVGTKTETHLLGDGEWYYLWASYGQAVKIKADKLNLGDATSSAQKIMDIYANMVNKPNIKCEEWIRDESVFLLPNQSQSTDVSFTVQEPMTTPKPTSAATN